jgi:hypothetical protein
MFLQPPYPFLSSFPGHCSTHCLLQPQSSCTHQSSWASPVLFPSNVHTAGLHRHFLLVSSQFSQFLGLGTEVALQGQYLLLIYFPLYSYPFIPGLYHTIYFTCFKYALFYILKLWSQHALIIHSILDNLSWNLFFLCCTLKNTSYL